MNPIAVVAFAGPAGSGKDTAGAYLIERYGFQKLSFARALKAGLAAMGYPEPATQDEKEKLIPELGVSWRTLAQTLGTEWGREKVHPDIWVILAEKAIRNEGGRFVITDLRFENEAAMVRQLNGVIAHIEGRAHAMAEGTKGHASEAGIKRHIHDHAVNNAPYMVKGQEDVDSSRARLYTQLDALVRYVGVQ